jgi:iron(III) transport system substrate-binding protein
MSLKKVLHFFTYVGCGAFATWLLLAIVAAILNIPNYGAKWATQTCNCKVPANLVVYIDVGGFMIGLGILIPTLLFTIATIFQILRTKSKRSNNVKAFTRFFSIGVVVALLVASILLFQSTPAAVEDRDISTQEVTPYPITVRLLNGTLLNLERLSGRMVIIEFFSPKCPLCELQLSELKKFLEKGGKDVNCLLMIPNWYNEPIEESKLQTGNNMLIGYDISSATSYYNVDGLPTLLIIDLNHKKALLHRGLAKEPEIIALLTKLGSVIKGNLKRTTVEEAALQEGSLIIFIEDFHETALLQQLAEGFKAKYPNITVTILWPTCCGSGKIYWVPDVITGSDMSLLLSLKAEGRLRVIEKELLNAYPEWAKDSEGFWVAQGIKVAVPVYNKAFINNPPTSLAELTKMCEKAVLAKPDYTIDNAPFVVLTKLYGLEYWRSFQQSAALVAPLFKVADIIASGERVITPYLPLSEYVRARKLNSEVSYFIPEEGVFVRLSWIALPVNSPHPNAGKLWLDYVLSAEGQLLRQNIYHELSARLDVQKNEYTEITKAIQMGKVLQPDWSTYRDDFENYVNNFDKMIISAVNG